MPAVATVATPAELVAALRAQRQHESSADPGLDDQTVAGAPLVRAGTQLLVVPAHSGAGATTVSVALADALSRSARPVQLVDLAPSESSGMLGATDREMGEVAGGWRTGRRGPATTVRRLVHASRLTDLPGLPGLPSSGRAAVIIDVGTDWRTLTASPNAIWPPAPESHLLVVCRTTIPGVRHAEAALDSLPGDPFVAGVGARRWPRSVAATFGPRLGAARRDGRVATVPADRRLELNGIEAEPLAKPVVAAASQLAGLIWPRVWPNDPGSQVPDRGARC